MRPSDPERVNDACGVTNERPRRTPVSRPSHREVRVCTRANDAGFQLLAAGVPRGGMPWKMVARQTG